MPTDQPPPDRPTERLQPSPSPPPVYEERVVAAEADTHAILLRLEDAIGSLRTGLMVVGVLAVAALGVAIYSLVEANEDSGGSRSGASDARVSELDDRVDRISRQVQDVRSGDGEEDASDVEGRVEALEKTVQELAERPTADPQQAIDQLSERIDEVANDVEALEQNQTTP